MKNIKRVRPGLAAILLAFAVHAQAYDTQVLLPDPNPDLSELRPIGNALLVDPLSVDPAQPSLFLGLISDGSIRRTIWRISPDPAYPQYTAEPLDAGLRRVTKLAYNPVEQRLYAVGDAILDPTRRNSPLVWKVRSSEYTEPGIMNWGDVDTVFLDKRASSLATGIAFDANGAVFVSGRAKDSKGYFHWMVRRKLLGNTTWETVYHEKLVDKYLTPKLCFFPGDNNNTAAMFMVGNLNNKWTILRSFANSSGTFGDLGTWEPVDQQMVGGPDAAATDIGYDSSSGKLYVVGCRGRLYTTSTGWIVRASSDGGQNWGGGQNPGDPLLDMPLSSNSYPNSLTIDHAGNVSISGLISPDGTKSLWHVMRCTDPSSTDPNNLESWGPSFKRNLSPFNLDHSSGSDGRGIVADPSGVLFNTGVVWDWIDNTDSSATTYSGGWAGLLRIVPPAP